MVGSFPFRRGVALMTVFEGLMLTFTFGALVIAILSFNQKQK